jgi:ABC-2 type transport system ATP-binding protein
MSTLLNISGLTKRFGECTALDNISLSVNRGDIYGVVGGNGAGKTTLVKLLLGLTEATSGSIGYALHEHPNDTDDAESGTVRHTMSPFELDACRRHIGSMFEPHFNTSMTAAQNLNHYAHNMGIGGRERRWDVDEALETVGLQDTAVPVKAYSAGMVQRLAIAQAFLGSPTCVVLDDPVNYLDTHAAEALFELIRQINAHQDTTFIITSRSLKLVAKVADRFGFLDRGRLFAESTAEELQHIDRGTVYLKVDSPEQAANLLENNLRIVAHVYEQLGQQVLALSGPEIDTAMVAHLLVNAGVDIYDLHRNSADLDSYFASLCLVQE